MIWRLFGPSAQNSLSPATPLVSDCLRDRKTREALLAKPDIERTGICTRQR